MGQKFVILAHYYDFKKQQNNLLDDFAVPPDVELVLLVIEELVGVAEGFTDGDACDPGEDEAAIAACLDFAWTLAAILPNEKSLKPSESESSPDKVLLVVLFSPALGLAVADFLGPWTLVALVSSFDDFGAFLLSAFLLDFFGLSDSEADDAELLVVLVVGNALVLGRLEGTFLVLLAFLSLLLELFLFALFPSSAELLLALELDESVELLFFLDF